MKIKISIYAIVFGAIGIILIAAGLSTFFFNKNFSAQNSTLTTLRNYGPAPDIQGIPYWINSPPLHTGALKGKVVLVDFWTYSCINCIRTIPYLNAWESKYGNNGLVIIGVHTPEFQFEQNYSNVAGAVQKFGIKYPVAMDSNYSTWIAYGNRFWPADYLVDKNGNIRDVHYGEGDYAGTEHVIQLLLKNAGYNSTNSTTNITSNVNLSGIGTPELYLGYATLRAQIGNKEGLSQNKVINYSAPNITQPNVVYLYGKWYNAADSIVAVNNNSRILLSYKAKNVNIVASGNYVIAVRLDGNSLPQSYFGSDTQMASGITVSNIAGPRLYNIISAPSYGSHFLEIDANPNFRVYTFTFG